MEKKRYEVPGMMEWHPIFKAGRTRIQVSFTGGHLCGGASTAATYETSDPVVQAVIERSEYFRSGRIRLGKSENTDKSGKPEVFEYSKDSEIFDYLEEKHGVKADDILDLESCLRVARRLGIILKKK